MSWDIEQVKREIRGPAGLAMATFDDELRLDVEALKGNLRYMVDNGVGDGKGFVICPSGTGEYLSLSDEEHLLMTEAALGGVRGEDGRGERRGGCEPGRRDREDGRGA